MAAALNGIALQSLTRAYGGTFLTFSDYMRPAVRLAALMQLPAIYVWTHDSIGLGEDGPTHQPVEQLTSLRNIPRLDVVRPGDANETSICWRTIIEHTNRPAGIVLSRQNIPVLDRGDDTGYAPADAAARSGYILAEADGGTRSVLLIGTGSEVQVALDARDLLQSQGIPARIVSMPCVEWFAAQDLAYRDTVLPPGIRARVSVEAGVSSGWEKIIGDAGRSVGVEDYGASADYQTLYRQFGNTAAAVAAAARDSIHDAQNGTRPGGHPATFAPAAGGTADRPA
jgi:transketolase